MANRRATRVATRGSYYSTQAQLLIYLIGYYRSASIEMAMRSIFKAFLASRVSAQRMSLVEAATTSSHPSLPRFFSSESEKNESEKNAEKLLDLMTQSSAMQAMMLNALPPAARNPDVIKQLLKDPAMKQKLVKQLASMNLRIPSHILQSMSASHMDETFQRARKMGVDPQAVFSKLQSHPRLLGKLQEPKVMEAFQRIDIAIGS
jgi:hypothetical protein